MYFSFSCWQYGVIHGRLYFRFRARGRRIALTVFNFYTSYILAVSLPIFSHVHLYFFYFILFFYSNILFQQTLRKRTHFWCFQLSSHISFFKTTSTSSVVYLGSVVKVISSYKLRLNPFNGRKLTQLEQLVYAWCSSNAAAAAATVTADELVLVMLTNCTDNCYSI